MSDDEEIVYVKKQKTIHYGSLEDQERTRLATLAAAAENDGDQKAVGGNINVSNGNTFIFNPTERINRHDILIYLSIFFFRIFRFGGCHIQRQTSAARRIRTQKESSSHASVHG